MYFPETVDLTDFVKEFYSKNLKKFLIRKIERVYFPKDTSKQMAEKALSYVQENHRHLDSVTLRKNPKTKVYYFDVKYTEKKK